MPNVSSMRFESKHKQLKATAHAVTSRKNILYTIALKNQLNFSYRIMAKNGLKNIIEFGHENYTLNESTLEYQVFKAFLNFNMSDQYFATIWIKINGIKYYSELVLVIDYADFLSNFGVINTVIVNENSNEVYFILNKINTLTFNEHFHAYEIERTESLLCEKWSDLHNNIPTSIHIVDGNFFVLTHNE